MPDALRILFAEDEATFRLSVKKALSDYGYIVEAVESGEDAVAALNHQEFDVIILDYTMSGISGLNVLHHMHEQKDDTPVIVLTGTGSESIAVEVLKLGAYDYIRKEHLELRHLPIIVNGVHERYLFRLEKEQRMQAVRERELVASLLDSFHDATSSLARLVNNSLAVLSLNIQEYAQTLLPHVEESAKDQFRLAFQELDREYNLIASTVKTMLNLSTALQNRLSGTQAMSSKFDITLPDQIGSPTQQGPAEKLQP